MFVKHPLLKEETIEEREYQLSIAQSCLKRSTLVVLPTGMGKTVIAVMVLAETLQRKEGKSLFLAPTKPLVEQHASSIEFFFKDVKPAVFTGEVPPHTRPALWKDYRVVVSTPQVIVNDLESGRASLDDVDLIIFDEAHRAVGDYSYVYIGRGYKEKNGLAMGMTASPGSDTAKILEVCDNLGISGVEIRSEYDPDVVKYVHDIDLHWIRLEVPENLKEISRILKKALNSTINNLRRYGFLRTGKPVSTKDILSIQGEIQARLKVEKKNFALYHAATMQAMAMKINHAIELAETQGLHALRNYIDRLKEDANSEEASKASKKLLKMKEIQEVIRLSEAPEVHRPKLEKIREILSHQFAEKEDSRVIIFTHYRDTSQLVTRDLKGFGSIRPVRFVGQTDKEGDRGLKQAEQVDAIRRFKEGLYNVLVATSVAEEGLDIPSTDLVIFYEPVPSEIRTIQRRGRTGRKRPGKVAVLGSKDTRDEAYFYSAKRKERRMHRELERLRKELKQKIFVGGPGGTSFREAGGDRIRELRGLLEEEKKEKWKKRKKVQTSLADF